MQIEFAVSASNHLIAEDGQLLIVVASIESEGKFMLVRGGGSSSSEFTAIHYEIIAVESHILLI